MKWSTADVSARAGTDYQAVVGGTVTFGPNEMMKPISVSTLADLAAEGDEALRVVLHDPIGMTIGTPSAGTVTIQDAQQGLQFSSPSYQVTEGMATATITVVRTGPTDGTVTVRYSTAPGTATPGALVAAKITPGADYVAVAGTLTFGPGVKQQTFTIPIANDGVAEGAETVLLALAAPTGAQLGPQSGATLLILDNDLAGQIKLSAATYTAGEAAGTVTIMVQRVGNAEGATVQYRTVDGSAVAGEDYFAARGTLTFKQGETTKTFTVRILSDSRDEPNETFTVLLENPGGGATLGIPSSALVTITDDDVPGLIAFSQATYMVTEAGARATIVVNRAGGQAGGVTVDLQVTGGAAVEGPDWTGPLPTRLTFAPGEMSKQLTIAIIDDPAPEGREAIFLRLLNPGGGAALGAISTAAVVIADNDPGALVYFDTERLTLSETAKTVTLNVVRGLPGANQGVTLSLNAGCVGRVALAPPSAPTTRTIAFLPTQLSVPVALMIADDSIVQGPCEARLALVTPTGGLSMGTVREFVLTVLDNDATISFTSATYAFTEGGNAPVVVQRIGALDGTMTVKWTATNVTTAAGDYAGTSGVLTFGPGVASVPVPIMAINDVVPEVAETFALTLSAPTGGGVLGAQTTATVTINPDALDLAGIFQFTGDVTVVEGGVATLTVTRTGGSAGPVLVSYQTQDGTATALGKDYVAKNAVVLTFPAGATSQTVTISTLADTLVEGPETLRVLLAVPPGSLATLGSRNSSTITVIDAQTARVQLGAPAYSVSESAGVLSIPVSRMGPTTQVSTVNWTAAPGTALGGGVDYTAAGGTLTFPAGSTAPQTITIGITGDLLSEPTKTFTVVLTTASAGTQIGTPGVALVTLVDDDVAGQVQFGAAASAVLEGQTALLTLVRTAGVAAGVQVSVIVDGASTAAAGTDYSAFTQSYVFGAGESLKVVSIPTTAADAASEAPKVLRLRVQVTGGGATVGAVGETALWIVDDVPTLRFEKTAATVTEGDAITITVLRSGPMNTTVTANYFATVPTTATEGADYVSASGALTFLPGVASQTFQVQTKTDSTAEPSETIFIVLGVGAGAAADPAGGTFTLTILDKQKPNLVVSEVIAPVQAGTGLPMNVTVTVRNLAGLPAPKSKLAIFLAPLPAPFGQQIALVDAPPIPAGASVPVALMITIPPDMTPGSYFVAAQIDALGTVDESNESDNGGASPTLTQVIAVRPDLVITSVPSPANVLTGKLLSAPLHVRNAGAAASGPFRVGVFLSRNQSTTDALQLGTRVIPGLGPGMGVDIPMSLAVPDTLSQGAYYVAALADIDSEVVEGDETNNSLASAVPFQITTNLGKLARVSASFTTANVGGGCAPEFANQTIDLTGTLSVTVQPGTTGSGTITLNGFVQGAAVRFVGTFVGTVFPNDTVQISFDVNASGAFSGRAIASGSGTLVDGVLQANVAGTLLVPLFPVCPFSGALTVTGQTTSFFSLLHFAQGGAFSIPPPGVNTSTPSPTYPLPITHVSAAFTVVFDPLPPVDEFLVRFTGPAGSGFANTPADDRQDFPDASNPVASFYETDTFPVAGRKLSGTWTVRYRNATQTFSVPDPEAEKRFVAMLPTVTLNAAQTHILSVSWVYKDRRTGVTVPAPLHADSIQVEIDPNGYKSPDMPRTVFSHTFPAPGIPLSGAAVMYISYKDTLTGNFYVSVYCQPGFCF